MRTPTLPRSRPALASLAALVLLAASASAQVGRRLPSEREVVPDPVTGIPITFLTKGAGDSKIYPTHEQFTADGQWVVFRSNRVRGQAFAVHEQSGVIVQLTERGYQGALCVAKRSMKLYFPRAAEQEGGPSSIIEVDLAALLADSEAGTLRAEGYERVCGVMPEGVRSHGELALDADEQVAYFRVTGGDTGALLPEGTPIAATFGPRNMGAGPSGIRAMDLRTGEVTKVCDVPFQVGHVQANPWVPGEVVFCWETGGKAPTRMWTVSTKDGLPRPVYAEREHDWVTHEVVITPDEVAFAILGHRTTGTSDAWGPAGTRQFATGLAVANLRTGEVHVESQVRAGSGYWHVAGSHDGRWVAGDDFDRNLWLVDRETGETMLWTAGHLRTAADHPHPTFAPCGTKVQFQSAMGSEDGRSLRIAVVPVPEAWLARAAERDARRGGAPFRAHWGERPMAP